MVADRDHRATGASAQQVARDDDERSRPDQTEIIDPSVGVEGQAERRRWRVDLDTLDAAGPIIESLEFENLGSRHGEGKGGKGEVQTFEPQRRQPEQETGTQTDRTGDRHGRPIRNASLVEQDRRRVGADRVERSVAQRNLAVEAGQDVESQHSYGVDQHLTELRYVIATDRKRKDAGGRQDRCNTEASPYCPREKICHSLNRGCLVEYGFHHTRATRVRPNKPAGLKTRTPTMITRATVSFSSVPTT